MSATDAEKFIDKMENDPQFRARFEAAESWEEAWEIVQSAGLRFSEAELQALVLARAEDGGTDDDKTGWKPGAHW